MMQSNERRDIRGKTGPISVGICLSCLIVILFVAPASSYAQCTATSTTFTTGPGVGQFVDKTLSMLTATVLGGGCTVGVATPPAFCGRVAPNIVRAGAPLASLPTPVACNFVCNTTGVPGTCNVTIDNSDGLPVELMDFAIEEDEDPSDSEAREPPPEDADQTD